MARRCAICGKGPVAGGSFSHSHVRTRRRFLPNLQKVRIKVEGAERRAQVCTSCMKSRRASRVR